MKSDNPLEIPKSQLERIEPIVDSLLAELRRGTRTLSSQTGSALVYDLETERLVAVQRESEAGE